MKIALCQLNPVTGDITGNTGRITETLKQHDGQQVDLFVFPELFIVGYPPLDLLENNWFIAQGLTALDELCRLSLQHPDTGILTGIPLPFFSYGGSILVTSLTAVGLLLNVSRRAPLEVSQPGHVATIGIGWRHGGRRVSRLSHRARARRTR